MYSTSSSERRHIGRQQTKRQMHQNTLHLCHHSLQKSRCKKCRGLHKWQWASSTGPFPPYGDEEWFEIIARPPPSSHPHSHTHTHTPNHTHTHTWTRTQPRTQQVSGGGVVWTWLDTAYVLQVGGHWQYRVVLRGSIKSFSVFHSPPDIGSIESYSLSLSLSLSPVVLWVSIESYYETVSSSLVYSIFLRT